MGHSNVMDLLDSLLWSWATYKGQQKVHVCWMLPTLHCQADEKSNGQQEGHHQQLRSGNETGIAYFRCTQIRHPHMHSVSHTVKYSCLGIKAILTAHQWTVSWSIPSTSIITIEFHKILKCHSDNEWSVPVANKAINMHYPVSNQNMGVSSVQFLLCVLYLCCTKPLMVGVYMNRAPIRIVRPNCADRMP